MHSFLAAAYHAGLSTGPVNITMLRSFGGGLRDQRAFAINAPSRSTRLDASIAP